MPTPATSASPPAAPRASARRLGGYELVRLLGKSERTMCWQAGDARTGQEMVLVLPRQQPDGPEGIERWARHVRKAHRLDHPNLAHAVEIGVHEGWPFAAYELEDGATLADRIGNQGLAATDAASIVAQLVQGLAFVHDAGLAHRDVQAFNVLVSDRGQVRLLGTEVAGEPDVQSSGVPPRRQAPSSLHAQRDAAAADVLQAGLLLHHALGGQPALDEPDTAKAADRLPPHGRDIIRLPWTLPRPVHEALRAIANRATDRQERQRYRNARTLLRALEGWLQVEGGTQADPIVLLVDRLRSVGVLPALPGAAERAAHLALMERERTSELADVVLQDTALAFELLRLVNTAQLRSGQVSGTGPVLTIRRAIAMIGLEGVRRAALGLRAWPGPLNEGHAADLRVVIDRVRRAGRVAVAIRPAGYDAEVVYLVTLLQNLGRLVVQYHFAEEAAQIRRLMQSAAAPQGEGEEPGMSEQAASMAVLGIDLEAIGQAVALWWGLDETVLHMIRHLSTDSPVRAPDNDDEILRATASCATELVDAVGQPAARVAHAVQHVVQRYARALGLSLKDAQAALADAGGGPAPAEAPARATAPRETT